MRKHTDYEFLRALAIERENRPGANTFDNAVAFQLYAIANQIERLSKTQQSQLLALCTLCCEHSKAFHGPHVAIGHIVYCTQCMGPSAVVDIRCVTIDLPVS